MAECASPSSAYAVPAYSEAVDLQQILLGRAVLQLRGVRRGGGDGVLHFGGRGRRRRRNGLSVLDDGRRRRGDDLSTRCWLLGDGDNRALSFGRDWRTRNTKTQEGSS